MSNSLLQVHQVNGYVNIARQTAKDRRLTMRARGLLMDLLSNSETFSLRMSTFIEQNTLKATKENPNQRRQGERVIRDAMAELIEFEYVVCDRQRNEHGQHLKTVYHTYPLPYPQYQKLQNIFKNQSDEPYQQNVDMAPHRQNVNVAKSPHRQNPHVDNPHVENAQLINISNNKYKNKKAAAATEQTGNKKQTSAFTHAKATSSHDHQIGEKLTPNQQRAIDNAVAQIVKQSPLWSEGHLSKAISLSILDLEQFTKTARNFDRKLKAIIKGFGNGGWTPAMIDAVENEADQQAQTQQHNILRLALNEKQAEIKSLDHMIANTRDQQIVDSLTAQRLAAEQEISSIRQQLADCTTRLQQPKDEANDYQHTA